MIKNTKPPQGGDGKKVIVEYLFCYVSEAKNMNIF